MKRIEKRSRRLVFQGDIMVVRVERFPEGAKPLTGPENNVVAHSETGHHHIAEGAEVFSVPDGMELYMRAIGKTVTLRHLRDNDTHEPIQFDAEIGDIFKIRRQREQAPDGWKRVED